MAIRNFDNGTSSLSRQKIARCVYCQIAHLAAKGPLRKATSRQTKKSAPPCLVCVAECRRNAFAQHEGRVQIYFGSLAHRPNRAKKQDPKTKTGSGACWARETFAPSTRCVYCHAAQKRQGGNGGGGLKKWRFSSPPSGKREVRLLPIGKKRDTSMAIRNFDNGTSSLGRQKKRALRLLPNSTFG